MIENFPDGWRVEKLGDICQFINGYSFKSNAFQNHGIPIVRIGNLVNDEINLADSVCYKEDNKLKPYIIYRSDILIAMSGVTTGKMAFSNLDKKLYLNQRIGAMRTNKSILLSKYLFNFLLGKKSYLLSLAGGSAQPNLSSNDIKKLIIPIPPLPQQEKIVKVLDISSALIEKQKELIKNYDLFLKSKFIEMFGDPIKNPFTWEVEKLEKLANIKTTSINSDRITNEIYIALDSIEKNTGKLVKVYKSDESNIKSNKYIFTSDMLLYGKLRPYLNKVLLPSFNGICSTDILPIKPIDDISTKQYVAYYLRHTKIVELLSNSVSGANLPRVSPKILRNLNIQNPPLTLQNKFASIVEKTEIIKEKENKKLTSLQTLHNSLMDKAFKGEII
ncbi:restriction endonuclease subunit S [Sulfurimonas sp. CS5]|uniref:restriction endonuclease subunit S n=1 Tax=Sulfurimonas sp. CS5 TaxID=3391145 RepID=UPI0039E7C4E3